MAEFDGKVILVTGGGTGLGAAIAIGAAKRGAKALLLNYSKSRKEAEATAKAVQAAGAEAQLVQGDVGEDADCRKIAAAATSYGKLDVLVNNAGTTKHVPKHADLDGLSKEDFLRIYAINTVAGGLHRRGRGRRGAVPDLRRRASHHRRDAARRCRPASGLRAAQGALSAVIPEFREAKYPGPRGGGDDSGPGSRLSALPRSGRDDRRRHYLPRKQPKSTKRHAIRVFEYSRICGAVPVQQRHCAKLIQVCWSGR